MENSCCSQPQKKEKGLLKGILYGLLPHTFCIGFVIFSVIGSVSAVAIFKKFLILPYFFHILVALSFIMATISAVMHLKKNNCLCKSGIKSKWRYLTILYATTIFVNLIMFSFVFPTAANTNFVNAGNTNVALSNLSAKVEIPCSGHAPLIVDELKKDSGVRGVTFRMPNIFNISYDDRQTSPEKIVSLEIFKTYRAVIQN